MNRLVWLVAGGVGFLTPVSAPLLAATEQEFSVEEIVVTARRRAESVQDVPGTVTAVTEATLQAAGVERPADFVKLIPGVSLVDAAEVGDTQVNIRGINGSRDAENSFAYIVDGVLYTCLLYTSPSPRDLSTSRMPSSA